jgi:hypothetical protein
VEQSDGLHRRLLDLLVDTLDPIGDFPAKLVNEGSCHRVERLRAQLAAIAQPPAQLLQPPIREGEVSHQLVVGHEFGEPRRVRRPRTVEQLRVQVVELRTSIDFGSIVRLLRLSALRSSSAWTDESRRRTSVARRSSSSSAPRLSRRRS